MRFQFNYFRTLEMAYRLLLECGLVQNQTEFSTRILGRTAGYFSCMKARNRQPSFKVMEDLYEQTIILLRSFAANPQLNSPHAENLNHAYHSLIMLRDTLGLMVNGATWNWCNQGNCKERTPSRMRAITITGEK